MDTSTHDAIEWRPTATGHRVPRSAPAQLVGKARAELQAPLPNALIGDDHTTSDRGPRDGNAA